MIIRKKYIYIITASLLLALIFVEARALHHEWRAAYTVLFQKTYYKVNLVKVQLLNVFDGIYRPLVATREKGLPVRRLYISGKARNALMEDMPKNTRKWQRAFMMYPDNQLQRVKVRHRGDNPTNWAFHKKSWRVKLQKKFLIDNVRVFNLIVPQEENQFLNYLPHYIGRLAGVLAPQAKLVESFINDEPQGIYHEIEHIDESFLRNNRIMPVNIYKGEQVNRERQIMIGTNLYDNPGLWSKLTVFNQARETDFSDLEYFLELISRGETSESDFSRLKQVARFEDWARFSAFQTMVQSWHNSSSGNSRLVIDPWRGTVLPVVHDTLSFLQLSWVHNDAFDIIFDAGGTHPLYSLYQGSSKFLVEKYKILFGFVEEGLILKFVRHIETLFPSLERSFSRDYFRYERVFTSDHLANPLNLQYSLANTTSEGMKANWERWINILSWFQSTLHDQLVAPPPARWLNEGGFVGLIIDGVVPLDRVTLEFSPIRQLPTSIAWDADGDGRLTTKDVLIPFQVKGNQVELDAVWVANRVTASPDISDRQNPGVGFFRQKYFTTAPTQFRLIGDTNLAPVSVQGANFLTGESFLIPQGKNPGNTPSRRNIPVIEKKQEPVEVWSKNRTIEGTHLINRPVRILPGTTLRMRPGASLVFRNRVQVEGKPEAPVRIISDVPGEPWGTVALHGSDTAGSVLSHLIAENGSGASIENVRYIGMLSVHEARDVKFQNLVLRKNTKFDDMMHVVYSKDIHLRDCVFEGAFSDGLDVDISTIRIQRCQILGSGNDAVDLMDSKALIMESELSHSGDKGVSVGEASDVVIYNSSLHHNATGVETKDDSVAHIINSKLAENKRQINAYKKNWRYGGGGRVMVDKSVFSSVGNPIQGDKKSDIRIYDSTFSPSFGETDKQVMIDSLSDDSGEQRAASADYRPITAKALQSWGVKGNAGRRGTLQ